MNDIVQIDRANHASIVNTNIQSARACGKFVVAKYDGLHLVGHIEAGDKAAADAVAADLKKSAGVSERFEVLAPTR